MAKRSENSRSDGTQQSDAAADYEVGYGRTPEHTRFKSGHPKRGGRRKGQRNVRTVMRGFLNERVTFCEGKRTRRMSKRDAMCLSIVNAALAGNDKAQSKVFSLMMSEEASEGNQQEPFTGDDAALLADFARRYGKEAEPAESTEEPETGKAAPPNKQTQEKKA
jgi:Family of unknown function (DUF5681)